MLIKPKISLLLFLILLYTFGFAVCNCDSSVITIENYTDVCESDCGDCNICDTDAYYVINSTLVVINNTTPFDFNLGQPVQIVPFSFNRVKTITESVYFVSLKRGPPKKITYLK
jgi:hypothetical protein